MILFTKRNKNVTKVLQQSNKIKLSKARQKSPIEFLENTESNYTAQTTQKSFQKMN